MAEDLGKDAHRAPSVSVDDAAPLEVPAEPSGRRLWQIPVIILSIGMIVVALYIRNHRDEPAVTPAQVLVQAAALIEDGRAGDAGAVLLAETVGTPVGWSSHEDAHRHALLAQALWIRQQRADRPDARIAEAICTHSAAAHTGQWIFSPPQSRAWGENLVILGRLTEAMAVADELLHRDHTLDASTTSAATTIHRLVIERGVGDVTVDHETMTRWIQTYRTSGPLNPGALSWIAQVQARRELSRHAPRTALDRLLVDIRLLESRGATTSRASLGQLQVVLGHCYLALGEMDHASDALDRAESLLPVHDRSRAESHLARGAIAMASCDYAGAKESFTQVLTSWPDEHFPVAAWAGRSVSWSRLGDAVAARGDLLEAIKSYTPSRAIGAVSLAMLAQVAIDEHDAAALRHDLPAAAAWITVVMDLDVPDHLQLAIIERFAGTHQALAEGVGSGQIVLDDATSASTLAMQAGDVFLRAAQYHAATPGASSKGMLSLHQAAICYNTAGRQDLAIDACQEYVATTSVEDPTRVEVLRLLGTAHEAQLEYEAAADAYLEAIETHPRSLSASASRVPLARVLLALDRPGEAQSVLLHVLDGRDELLTPEAADYREAVIALGHLYWSQERFIPAIERLTEAINRYGDDPRAATLRFQLAGAYRGAAAALGSAAATATTPSEVDAIAAVEHDHLQDAAEGFARVVEIYQEWTGQPLTIIQDDQYRQALLWYADCLFEMEQYAPAATAYDDAARTFHDHASSVYALVQVVNACSAMGDQEQAQAAHRRALVRLDELPNVAFEGPDAVMARNAWDQWMLNAPVAAVETQ